MYFLALKNKINYKNIMKVMLIFTITFLIFNIIYSQTAHAEGLLDYGSGDNPFNKISDSWGQFVADKFRNNYSLDSGKIGTLEVIDKGLNALSNGLFFLVMIIAWLGINIFNFCFSSNISGTFATHLEGVSEALHNGVFDKFFMIFFMVSLISLVIYFVKRNYAAIFTQIIGTALISVFALTISLDGGRDFVMDTTNFSKEIGMTLVASLSNESDTEVAKNDMIATLWGNLVHKPWVMLEFNGKVSVSDENKDEAIQKSIDILSLDPDSDERKEIAEKEITGVSFTGRLASTFILGLITIVKISILIIIGVVQIFLQILSNLVVVLLPLILLLAIVPFFGGFGLLKNIGEKYLGIQVTIVLLSFIIGSLILIDKVILDFFITMGASFTVALLIQCVSWILVIVFRKQLILSFNKLQRKVNGSIAAGNLMRKGFDKTAYYGNKVGEKVSEPIKTGAVNLKEAAGRNLEYAARYTTGKAGIAAAKVTANVIDKVASKWNKNQEKNNTGSVKEETFTKSKGETKNNSKNTSKEGAKNGKVVDIKDRLKKVKVEDKNGAIKNNTGENISEKLEEIKDREVDTVNLRDKTQEVESLKDNLENKSENQNEKINTSRENISEKLEEIREDESDAVNIKDEGQIKSNRGFKGEFENENRKEKINNLRENVSEKLEEIRDDESDAVNIKDKSQRKSNEEFKGEFENENGEENIKKLRENASEKLEEIKDDEVDPVNIKNTNQENKNIKQEQKKSSKNIKINEDDKVKNEKINDKSEPKVISFNDARVSKGKEKIDDKELKNNLRKDLQKEYIEEQKKKKAAIEKAKSKTRAEVLKNKLGVTKKQIKSKEKALNKELNKIKAKKLTREKTK